MAAHTFQSDDDDDDLDLDDVDPEFMFPGDLDDEPDASDPRTSQASGWRDPGGMPQPSRHEARPSPAPGSHHQGSGGAPSSNQQSAGSVPGAQDTRRTSSISPAAGKPVRHSPDSDDPRAFNGDREPRKAGKDEDWDIFRLLGPENIDWQLEYMIIYSKGERPGRDRLVMQYMEKPSVDDLVVDVGVGSWYFKVQPINRHDGIRRGGNGKRRSTITASMYRASCRNLGITPVTQVVQPVRMDRDQRAAPEESEVASNDQLFILLGKLIESKGNGGGGAAPSMEMEFFKLRLESMEKQLDREREENRRLQNMLWERAAAPPAIAQASNPELDEIRKALLELRGSLVTAQANPLAGFQSVFQQSKDVLGMVAQLGSTLSPTVEKKHQWLEVIEGLSENADGLGTLADVAVNTVQKFRGKLAADKSIAPARRDEKLNLEDDETDEPDVDWKTRSYDPVAVSGGGRR